MVKLLSSKGVGWELIIQTWMIKCRNDFAAQDESQSFDAVKIGMFDAANVVVGKVLFLTEKKHIKNHLLNTNLINNLNYLNELIKNEFQLCNSVTFNTLKNSPEDYKSIDG